MGSTEPSIETANPHAFPGDKPPPRDGGGELRPLMQRWAFLSAGMIAVFAILWISWFAPFDDWIDRRGTPLGGDFPMFYVAGQIAANQQWERLYDQSEHQRRLQVEFPGLRREFCLPYRYPPFVAAAMSFLARLPYPGAWLLFTCWSIGAYVVAIRWSVHRLVDWPSDAKRLAVVAFAGWPIALETVAGGQASLFGLVFVVAAIALARGGKPILAGFVLGLTLYKPNLAAVLMAAFAIRRPKSLVGIAISALALGAVSWGVAGGRGITEFLALSGELSSQSWDVETPFWKSHGLGPFANALAPEAGRLILSAGGLLAGVWLGWKWRLARERQDERAWIALALAANSLLNPYVPIYDLALLLPAILLALDWIGYPAACNAMSSECSASSVSQPVSTKRRRAIGVLLIGLAVFGPHFSQSLAKAAGFQVFPVILAGAAVAAYWHLARRAKTATHGTAPTILAADG